ncbi:MAG: DUF1566 domain-containing protein, partial [Methylococcales bacterium]|nr:DUF1566 domain-containing protein [Methylococcales bacterium]
KELNTLVYCSNGKVIQYKEDSYNSTIETEGSYGCESNSRGDYESPTIHQAVFPNTVASGYWSSSPYANLSYNAWEVHFIDGDDDYDYRFDTSYVRVVRSGQ